MRQTPQSYTLLHVQCDFLRSKGKLDWAVKLARQAVNCAPSEFVTWEKLTDLYVELGQFDSVCGLCFDFYGGPVLTRVDLGTADPQLMSDVHFQWSRRPPQSTHRPTPPTIPSTHWRDLTGQSKDPRRRGKPLCASDYLTKLTLLDRLTLHCNGSQHLGFAAPGHAPTPFSHD